MFARGENGVPDTKRECTLTVLYFRIYASIPGITFFYITLVTRMGMMME
jgi:hypothetical protein